MAKEIKQPRICKFCNGEAELIWHDDGVPKDVVGAKGMHVVTRGYYEQGELCHFHGKVAKKLIKLN